MKHYYFFWKSPLDKLFLLANETSLKSLIFIRAEEQTQVEAYLHDYQPLAEKNSVITQSIAELSAYFKGELTQFTVSVDPEGTAFQKKAWGILQGIRYGQVISYGEQALRLQNPKAMRAVGQANGRNPIPIIIPCHRVVAKNKTIGGYSGGIMIKQKLLAIENSLIPSMCGN